MLRSLAKLSKSVLDVETPKREVISYVHVEGVGYITLVGNEKGGGERVF